MTSFFADPPYDSGLYDQVLDAILKFDILPEGGIIVCESAREAALPDRAELLRRDYHYGQVKLTVYTRKAAEQ
jgi:16S rRNA G966 N2-methylase RsmD